MALSEQARQLYNAAARKYRKEHPDKVRKYNETYWEKKAALQVVTDVTDKNSVTDISVTSVTDELFHVPEGRKCIECGIVFKPKRADAKFCSSACKQKHYRNELT